MTLTRGKTYTTIDAEITVTIMNILEETGTYYKCRCAIAHRHDDTRVYELNGKYTLFKDRILNWEEVSEEK